MADCAKVALITGSGRRRVGNIIAHDLARHGYHIALHYHQSAAAAEATLGELATFGVLAAAFSADVGDEQQVEQLFDDVLRHFGRLDLLVTTASTWKPQRLEEITQQDIWNCLRIDAVGTFLCARRAGLIMAKQPAGGAVVMFGDWAIERPYPDYAGYFMAKGMIPNLTKTLAVELAQRNPKVRVNCILPGPVLFPESLNADERQALIEATLVRQANCPEAVSSAVRFLAENTFVTGVCLPVDGGRTIYSPE